MAYRIVATDATIASFRMVPRDSVCDVGVAAHAIALEQERTGFADLDGLVEILESEGYGVVEPVFCLREPF